MTLVIPADPTSCKLCKDDTRDHDGDTYHFSGLSILQSNGCIRIELSDVVQG